MVGGIDGHFHWGRQWDFANDVVTGNMTLYARWSLHTRTVSLQVNGGTRPNGQDLTRVHFTVFTGLGGVQGGRIIDPGPLTRSGYTFDGWYTDLSYTNEWLFSMLLYETDDLVPPPDPFTLYAKWIPNIYIVSFNAAGAPSPASQNIPHGDRVVRPPTPVNPGHSLVGWFRNLGDTTPWNFDTGIVVSSMTLHAIWDPDAPITVTFHLGTPPNPIPPLHPVFQTPAVQSLRLGDRVDEPFMPALPAGDITNHSFYRWYYHPDLVNVPGTVTDINTDTNPVTSSVRGALLPWDFNWSLSEALINAAGAFDVDGNLHLFARWVPPVPDMVWVPRGEFIMGDSGVSGTPAAYHAYPTRRVALDGFYISRYQVTQAVAYPLTTGYIPGYDSLMSRTPSQFTSNTSRPVERVSWFDAILYCNALTSHMNGSPHNLGLTQAYGIGAVINGFIPNTGTPGISFASSTDVDQNLPLPPNRHWHNGFRLPTEAEWEYAARGGHNSPGNFTYAGSNNAEDVAWFNTTVATQPAGGTQTVGRLRPNALGIFDMSGNVSEWVWDVFASYNTSYFRTASASDNPMGPPNAQAYHNPLQRVRRGGAWSNAAGNVRSVVRNSDTPNTVTWVNGFRVVRGVSVIW
jgi:uncharacterized repeat protein (TIGR02543 family)